VCLTFKHNEKIFQAFKIYPCPTPREQMIDHNKFLTNFSFFCLEEPMKQQDPKSKDVHKYYRFFHYMTC
jgi:hypothetical protein